MNAANPAEPQNPWWRDPRLAGRSCWIPTAVAALVCLGQLTTAHAMFGIDEFDDGVYFGTALRLIERQIPFRDYVYGHPPGFTWILMPLALVSKVFGTRSGFALVRVLSSSVAVANVWMLGRLLRHRGILYCLPASLALAVFPLAVTANKSSMFEPYLVCFVLVGLNLLFKGDRPTSGTRLVLAGACFGYGGLIAVPAIVPFVAALVACSFVWRRIRQHWARFIGGALAGFLLPSVPFLALAPGAFLRQVLVLQATRGVSSGSLSVGQRAVLILGLARVGDAADYVRLAAVVMVLLIGLIVVAGLVTPALSPLDVCVVIASLGTLVSILAPPDFFTHYTYLSAAFLGLGLGLAVGRLSDALMGRLPHPAWRTSFAVGIVIAILVFGAIGGVRGRTLIRDHPGLLTAGDFGPRIADVVPRGACVVSDVAALLISSNRFWSDRPCPTVLDPYFEWVAADPRFPPPSRRRPPDLVAKWRQWFDAADYVVLSVDPFRIPFDTALRRWFDENFERVARVGADVYRRRSP